MPSPDRLLGALDADHDDDPSVAKAMAEAARAEAQAAAARARAIRLSRQAVTMASGEFDTIGAATAADSNGAVEDVCEPEPVSASLARPPRRWWRRPGRQTLALGAAVLITCAGLAAGGYVVWYHHTVGAEHRRTAEVAAAARQSAITLMSINADKARQDVQRIIDDSTGPLKARMLLTADDLVKSVERSKISTKVAVKAVSVESMSNNSAVVLVAAIAEATGPDKRKPPPRSWRIVMTMQRDGGQLKMANVEMLP